MSFHEVSVMQINQMNFAGKWVMEKIDMHIYVCMRYCLWVFVCLKLCIFVHVCMVIGELS